MAADTPANAITPLVDAPAAESPDRPVVMTPGGVCTASELAILTHRVARGLARLGVAPGDRVALLLHDGVAFAATFLGALRRGAVAVPLSTRLGAAEVAALLVDARAAVVVAEPELAAPLRAAAAAAATRIAAAEDVLAADATPWPAEPVGLEGIAFCLYTSGTTGRPKAAMHRHRTLLAGRHYGLEVLGVSREDRVFATSRLFFAYALGNALLIPLLARAATFLHPAWPDPATVAEVMAAFRPTLLFSVPTLYARLLDADLPRATFASLRAAVSAGEPLPAAIHARFRAGFGVEILEGLGATETVFMVLSNRPGASRPGHAGLPVAGAEVRLLDGADRPVADGEPGVLWVRAASVAAGYWDRPDESRRAFVDGWFRTGDLFTRDREGFLVHGGREDDRFKVAGQWVVPGEVEAVALGHPAVLEAGLVGAAEGAGLVKPFLFLVPRRAAPSAGALAAEVRALLDARLPAHQRPREIRIVPELPRTGTGKLQRYRLRELVETGAPPS
jgi:benzoate-CoA ligase family protein